MKKALQLVELQGFLMEAGIGIEPVYTALQAAA
jgi:hypothetical protein